MALLITYANGLAALQAVAQLDDYEQRTLFAATFEDFEGQAAPLDAIYISYDEMTPAEFTSMAVSMVKIETATVFLKVGAVNQANEAEPITKLNELFDKLNGARFKQTGLNRPRTMVIADTVSPVDIDSKEKFSAFEIPVEIR